MQLLDPTRSLAILVSGGLDSAVLVGESLRTHPSVQPIYIKTGSLWEDVEFAHLRRFLDKIAQANLKPIHVLNVPVDDLYGPHWSLTGQQIPDENSPDEAVFLPGRNVLLLSKALIYCHLHAIPQIAMAPLEANPFPDATEEFFAAMSNAVDMAMQGTVRILRPYQSLSKIEVVRRGRGMPLGDTFSCIRPIDGLHCGHCNKCAERQHAFQQAGALDPTTYR